MTTMTTVILTDKEMHLIRRSLLIRAEYLERAFDDLETLVVELKRLAKKFGKDKP